MYSFTLYQSLKYTKQKKRFTGAGQKLLQHSVVSHWFNYTELEQQAEEVCLIQLPFL